MVKNKYDWCVEGNVLETGDLDVFEIDSERESNQRNYDLTDHRERRVNGGSIQEAVGRSSRHVQA